MKIPEDVLCLQICYKLCHDLRRVRSVCLLVVQSATVVHFLPALSGSCSVVSLTYTPNIHLFRWLHYLSNVVVKKVSLPLLLPLNDTVRKQNSGSLKIVELIGISLWILYETGNEKCLFRHIRLILVAGLLGSNKRINFGKITRRYLLVNLNDLKIILKLPESFL